MSTVTKRHPFRRRSERGVEVPKWALITALLALALAACVSSDVHVLGSSELIDQVRDLEVLPDGSVWVLNSAEPFFVGFDAEGAIVGQHGAAGGGPEEFRMPAGLLTGGLDGEAWTLDVVRHAFIRVSEPDEEWSQVAVPREEIPPGTVRGAMNLVLPTVRILKGGPAWLRIAPDGDVREIRLPERFDALRFTRDRIWGVRRDAFDVASLAWIGLPEGQ